MCYNYAPPRKIDLERSGMDVDIPYYILEDKPKYILNGFTFPEVPVIIDSDHRPLTQMWWGLIPSWVRDQDQALSLRSKTLNARSETLFDKPSFRSAARKHRCLIPAAGFFEWYTQKGKKYPHYIYSQDIMYFAGIHESWINKDTGEEIKTVSIVTKEANPLLELIHDKKRMPVILKPELREEWVKENNVEILKEILGSESPGLNAHSISKLITSRTEDNNVPEVQEEFFYPELEEYYEKLKKIAS
jgi:putative SOS response-associated peptidase YedK